MNLVAFALADSFRVVTNVVGRFTKVTKCFSILSVICAYSAALTYAAVGAPFLLADPCAKANRSASPASSMLRGGRGF